MPLAGLVSSGSRRGVRRVSGQGCEAEEREGQAAGVAAAGAAMPRDAGDAEGPGDGVADGGEALVRGGGPVPAFGERDIAGDLAETLCKRVALIVKKAKTNPAPAARGDRAAERHHPRGAGHVSQRKTEQIERLERVA